MGGRKNSGWSVSVSICSISCANISSPLALPLGELSPKVTERAFRTHFPSPSSLRSATSPKGRGKGCCSIPLCLFTVWCAPPLGLLFRVSGKSPCTFVQKAHGVFQAPCDNLRFLELFTHFPRRCVILPRKPQKEGAATCAEKVTAVWENTWCSTT